MREITSLDEVRRDRFMQRLRTARESGEIVVTAAINDQDAEIIQFPQQPEGDDAA